MARKKAKRPVRGSLPYVKKAVPIILVVLLVAVFLKFPREKPQADRRKESLLKKFSSYEELEEFVQMNLEIGFLYMNRTFEVRAELSPSQLPYGIAPPERADVSEDYSAIRKAEGVDEADVVKTDGKYIYVVSENKVIILDAFPAENAKVLSEIKLEEIPIEIFIKGDRLVVFAETIDPEQLIAGETLIKIFDISDRANPRLGREIVLSGSYFNSRMIGDYVYAIILSQVIPQENINLPEIRSNGGTETIQASEIHYFDFPHPFYRFTIFLSVNIQDGNEEFSKKVFLMSEAQYLFISWKNIYVIYEKRSSASHLTNRMFDIISKILPPDVSAQLKMIVFSDLKHREKWKNARQIIENFIGGLSPERRMKLLRRFEGEMDKLFGEIARELNKTVIHRLSLRDGKIEHEAEGEVPGRVLNPFSMGEHRGRFMVATTTKGLTWDVPLQNSVYVLDKKLEVIGRLENLAQGEEIYSCRFLGDRAFLVPFRRKDPLFAIDLKDHRNPRVLDGLEIPGYSDYLHPYNEDHLICIGKEDGLEISLFDISDPKYPKEISKYRVGYAQTDSYVLQDHRALLFNKLKDLLVIPILVFENQEYISQGAFVFHISPRAGIVPRGVITHLEENVQLGEYEFLRSFVRRSLCINDVLYTISHKLVKMNDLGSLKEINVVSS